MQCCRSICIHIGFLHRPHRHKYRHEKRAQYIHADHEQTRSYTDTEKNGQVSEIKDGTSPSAQARVHNPRAKEATTELPHPDRERV